MSISCRQSHVGFSDRALCPWVRHFTRITSSYRRRTLSQEVPLMEKRHILRLHARLHLKTESTSGMYEYVRCLSGAKLAIIHHRWSASKRRRTTRRIKQAGLVLKTLFNSPFFCQFVFFILDTSIYRLAISRDEEKKTH